MTIDAGAYRLLGYSAAPVRPLVAVRREARALMRDARADLREARAPQAATAQPAYAAPATLPDVLAAIGDLLGRLGAWLLPPAAPVAPAPSPTAPTKGGARFVVSSYNILGSGHTVPGADAAEYASGPTRIRWAAELLRAKGVDVVGFQEMANDQAAAFVQAAGQDFGLFPGAGKGHLRSHNSIAWRKDTWDLVKASTVDMPSHKGRMQPSPIVRLRHKATGEEVVFTNFHNAPGYHIGAQQHNRDRARALQVDLVNRLQRETGLPVIVTGDMNEKDVYFRDMTTRAGMTAANQGPRGQAPKHMAIDWIFGSAGVRFRNYLRERGPLGRKISDHAMLLSEVRLPG